MIDVDRMFLPSTAVEPSSDVLPETSHAGPNDPRAVLRRKDLSVATDGLRLPEECVSVLCAQRRADDERHREPVARVVRFGTDELDGEDALVTRLHRSQDRLGERGLE